MCNLRFDDTNPETEALAYVTAIKDDVRWLGFEWGDREFYASDYFEQLYQYAVQLIKAGKAYVDSLKPDEVSAYRGGWNEPGKHSPDRNRPVEENLDLFHAYAGRGVRGWVHSRSGPRSTWPRPT